MNKLFELTTEQKIESLRWIINILKERRISMRAFICLRFKDWYEEHIDGFIYMDEDKFYQLFPELGGMVNRVGKELNPKSWYWGDGWKSQDSGVSMTFRIKKLRALIKDLKS